MCYIFPPLPPLPLFPTVVYIYIYPSLPCGDWGGYPVCDIDKSCAYTWDPGPRTDSSRLQQNYLVETPWQSSQNLAAAMHMKVYHRSEDFAVFFFPLAEICCWHPHIPPYRFRDKYGHDVITLFALPWYTCISVIGWLQVRLTLWSNVNLSWECPPIADRM